MDYLVTMDIPPYGKGVSFSKVSQGIITKQLIDLFLLILFLLNNLLSYIFIFISRLLGSS